MDPDFVGFLISVAVFFIFGIGLLLSTIWMRLRRRHHLARSAAEQQPQRTLVVSHDQHLAQAHSTLVHLAVERLVAHGNALQGIPLASIVHGNEFLADRPLHRDRARGARRRRVPVLLLEDGTRATVQDVVERAFADHVPPSAPSGPSVLELLIQMHSQLQMNAREPHNEPLSLSAEALVDELQRLEEHQKQRRLIAEMRASPLDADEVYGKGVPYTANPANQHVAYIPDESHSGSDDSERVQGEKVNTTPVKMPSTPVHERSSNVCF